MPVEGTATRKRSRRQALTYARHRLPGLPRHLPLTGKAEVAVGFMIHQHIYTTVGYFCTSAYGTASGGGWQRRSPRRAKSLVCVVPSALDMGDSVVATSRHLPRRMFVGALFPLAPACQTPSRVGQRTRRLARKTSTASRTPDALRGGEDECEGGGTCASRHCIRSRSAPKT